MQVDPTSEETLPGVVILSEEFKVRGSSAGRVELLTHTQSKPEHSREGSTN